MTTNGASHDEQAAKQAAEAAAPPTQDQVAQVAALMHRMEEPMRAVLGTTIRGLLVSFPGVAPHVVLNLVAFHTANFLGQSLQGDLAVLAGLRRGFREAFEEGLRKAPIIQPSGPQAPASMPTKLAAG